jgi:hypothetical protein
MKDGLKGPDMGRLAEDMSQIVLLQAKSYKNLAVLTSELKNNELLRQLASDLNRLKANAQPFTIEISAGVHVPVNRTLEWRVDWRKLNDTSFATSEELDAARTALKAMAAKVNDQLANDAMFRETMGLEPGDPVFQINLVLDGE